MLKSNWALESLPELVGTLSKIESFEGSWPVFWCSKVRKMTFWKKQVLVLGWLAVFLESLIDNGAASFQIDSSSSLPGPILEQSSPSLSPCHHPVVNADLGIPASLPFYQRNSDPEKFRDMLTVSREKCILRDKMQYIFTFKDILWNFVLDMS